MAQGAAAEGHEGLELGVGVVDAGHHGVLVGGTAAGGLRVGTHRLTQALEVVLTHAGHQLVARLLDGGVQRDCQSELLRLRGEAPDLGEHAAGGNGQVARADVEAVLGVEDAHGLKGGVVVEEGFALPHEHHAAHARAEVVGHHPDLVDDLAGAEVAGVAVATSGTEGAAHGAACLGRDAHAELVLAGHAHGLHERAVAHADEVLAGAVAGHLLLGDRYGQQRQGLGELVAQVRREVGHLLVGCGALAIQPLDELLGPECRGAHVVLQHIGKLGPRQGLDADGLNGCAFHVVKHLSFMTKANSAS